MKEEAIASPLPSAFISANSEKGFFSLYDEVFDCKKFDRIYVINGGPGTGKSTLLRKIASAAEARGIACETVLCSSDPSSLDGVILSHGGCRIGILDGTPPHARTLTAPAITEEIWNLGAFWRSERISAQKEKIIALSDQKALAYSGAYALLRALGALEKEARLALARSFDAEKASKQIRHKLQPLRAKGERERRFLRAFSTKGETVLSFPEEGVQNLLLIHGKNASAEIYLSFFEDLVCESRLTHTVFLSPLSPDTVDGIYVNESKTLIIKEDLFRGKCKGRRIWSDRFFSVEPEESKERRGISEHLKEMALSRLAEAGEAHRAMERCFGTGMDFEKLTAFAEEKTEAILRELGFPASPQRRS